MIRLHAYRMNRKDIEEFIRSGITNEEFKELRTKVTCLQQCSGVLGKTCSICQYGIGSASTGTITMCRHVYHWKCFAKHIMQGGRTCPNCRFPIQKEDYDALWAISCVRRQKNNDFLYLFYDKFEDRWGVYCSDVKEDVEVSDEDSIDLSSSPL